MMKLQATQCQWSLSHRNQIASRFLKEHHWVSYALTSKSTVTWGYQRDSQSFIQKGSHLPLRLPFCHLKSHSSINECYNQGTCKILHNFHRCSTFHVKSSGMICFTLYAHHPYITTVPKTWSGVFIVYWNDHRVNTLKLFWKRKWRGVTGHAVHC